MQVCRIQNCYLTSNKDLLGKGRIDKFDALLFHSVRLESNQMQISIFPLLIYSFTRKNKSGNFKKKKKSAFMTIFYCIWLDSNLQHRVVSNQMFWAICHQIEILHNAIYFLPLGLLLVKNMLIKMKWGKHDVNFIYRPQYLPSR